MNEPLPTTGTNALLAQLSEFVPDEFTNQLLPVHRGRGWRSIWSSAQLLRVLLLTLLTPAHSFNLLVQLLPEQRDWRRFARLPNLRFVFDFPQEAFEEACVESFWRNSQGCRTISHLLSEYRSASIS